MSVNSKTTIKTMYNPNNKVTFDLMVVNTTDIFYLAYKLLSKLNQAYMERMALNDQMDRYITMASH